MGSSRNDHIDALHLAVWSTYTSAGSSDPRKLAVGRSSDALTVLRRARKSVPTPLLGIALWNVVIENSPELAGPAVSSADFGSLLRDVLDLDLPGVQRILQDHRPSALPPYPNQLIFDARWKHPPSAVKDRSTASIEICVPKPFHELKKIVDPTNWAACPFFWRRITPVAKNGRTGRAIKVQLNLPTIGTKTVTAHVRSHRTALAARTEFEVTQSADLPICKGSVTVKKEEGRPQATRVVLERTLLLSPDATTTDQDQIVRYWLQAEIVCLVLQPNGGANSAQGRIR